MNLKNTIRPLVPPVLYEVAHRLKAGFARVTAAPTDISASLLPQSFSPRRTFAEAERDAGVGYGADPMLAKAHIGHAWLTEMQDYAAPMLASVAIAAQQCGNRPLRVLDFGGGRGSFRAYVHDFFGERIRTEWRVVETPEQVQFNDDLACAGFEFSTSIGSAPYDLAMFSGSLQYINEWQAPLREANAEIIYIARTPLDVIERPFLQSIVRGEHQCRFPGRVISKPALFDLLGETHELFAKWDFSSHLLRMGEFQSPAMLWRRRVK